MIFVRNLLGGGVALAGAGFTFHFELLSALGEMLIFVALCAGCAVIVARARTWK